MHANRLLSLQHPSLMSHHTRLVERRLSIQNQYVSIPKMPIDFLVNGGSPRVQPAPTISSMFVLLWSQKLVGDSGPLFNAQFILELGIMTSAVRRVKGTESRTSSTWWPSSYSTSVAPGYPFGPVMTRCRISWKLAGVTGSGNVNFYANTGGTPISLGSMLTSGEMTERAA